MIANNSLKAIIYTRFSPRPNEDECLSHEVQLDYCKKYCLKNNYQFVSHYKDEILSGGKFDRPVLWEAVSKTKKGFILIAYTMSRVSRSVLLSESIFQIIREQKGQVAFIKEGHQNEDDFDADMIRQILSAVDENKRKVTAWMTSMAMKSYQRQGRVMSRYAPYGFDKIQNEITGKFFLKKNQYEQLVIDRIIDLHDRKGLSVSEIIEDLNKNNYKPRQKRWYHANINKIIKNYDNEEIIKNGPIRCKVS